MVVLSQGMKSHAAHGTPPAEFVEIGLLLPANRAAALLELAQDRRQTVGQILRKLVDRALTEDGLVV
jgi:hypothetical protein